MVERYGVKQSARQRCDENADENERHVVERHIILANLRGLLRRLNRTRRLDASYRCLPVRRAASKWTATTHVAATTTMQKPGRRDRPGIAYSPKCLITDKSSGCHISTIIYT